MNGGSDPFSYLLGAASNIYVYLKQASCLKDNSSPTKQTMNRTPFLQQGNQYAFIKIRKYLRTLKLEAVV